MAIYLPSVSSITLLGLGSTVLHRPCAFISAGISREPQWMTSVTRPPTDSLTPVFNSLCHGSVGFGTNSRGMWRNDSLDRMPPSFRGNLGASWAKKHSRPWGLKRDGSLYFPNGRYRSIRACTKLLDRLHIQNTTLLLHI